jgi:hypothetical protein
MGSIWLVLGLVVSVPALMFGQFQGYALGFGTFATLFGLMLLLISMTPKKDAQ